MKKLIEIAEFIIAVLILLIVVWFVDMDDVRIN